MQATGKHLVECGAKHVAKHLVSTRNKHARIWGLVPNMAGSKVLVARLKIYMLGMKEEGERDFLETGEQCCVCVVCAQMPCKDVYCVTEGHEKLGHTISMFWLKPFWPESRRRNARDPQRSRSYTHCPENVYLCVKHTDWSVWSSSPGYAVPLE